MSLAKVQALGDDQWGVEGEMSFASVPDLWDESRKVFDLAENSQIEVNLEHVSHIDSAGIALLVAWMRWAVSRSKSIRFVRASAQVVALVRSSHLEGLLQFSLNNEASQSKVP